MLIRDGKIDGGFYACAARLFQRGFTVILVCLIMRALAGSVAVAQPPDSMADDPPEFGTVEIIWAEGVHPDLTHEIARTVSQLFAGAAGESRFHQAVSALLAILAESGYRHAVIAPGDFSLGGGGLSFRLVIDPGPRVTIAAWELVGLLRTDTVWLASLLDLPVGVVWTRELERRLRDRIDALEYLRMTGPPEIVSGTGTSTAVVRLHLEERAPTRLSGLLAAGGGEAGVQSEGLTGRFALALDGLFGRDRSLAVRYERPRGDQTLFNLMLRESGAFGRPLQWRLGFEEWERLDHRQRLEFDLGYALGQRGLLRAEWGSSYARITPGRSQNRPARVSEMTLGLARGPVPGNAWSRVRPFSSWRAHFGLSRRTESATVTRGRLDLEYSRLWSLGSRLSWSMRGTGRWWTNASSLGPGDEWFLGGDSFLRGYDERTVAAVSGWAGSGEIGYASPGGLGLAAFADFARLEPFGPERSAQFSAYSYGLALVLAAPDRRGRLELAWRDHAAWRDGILRLMIAQGW